MKDAFDFILGAETFLKEQANEEAIEEQGGEITDIKQSINQLKSLVEALSGIGKYLSDWDATTGLPETDPLTMPYTYGTGDYYIVSAVGDTNYKPNGASYDGTASTTEETDEVQPLDIYHYDGNQWTLLKLHIIFNGFVKKSEVESRTEVIEYLDGTTETVKPLYEAEG